jgi:addiction module RelE/StbE family toxin
MNLNLHPTFVKHYRKRITPNLNLNTKAQERIELFKKNRQSPVLKDHQLTGAKRHLRAFWITGDIRIVYLPVSENHVLFLDIGSHNQVY